MWACCTDGITEGEVRQAAAKSILVEGAYGDLTAPLVLLAVAWLTHQTDCVRVPRAWDGEDLLTCQLDVEILSRWKTPHLSFDRFAWLMTQVCLGGLVDVWYSKGFNSGFRSGPLL